MIQAAGSYFDGLTAGRHRVEVSLDEERQALSLTGEALATATIWPLRDIRALSARSERASLTVTLHAESGDESPRDPARLMIKDRILIDRLTQLCPDLFRADVARGTVHKIIKRSLLAVVAIVLMLFVILPRMADTLASIIPIEREVAFGKSVTAQIERALGAANLGELRCTAPEGLAALDRMIARLSAGQNLQYELEVKVFKHPMLNAFAAPGGQIVVMRGLLDQASGPDAVAAVLAHEIGHVENRDATRHALRAAGSAGLLSMVLGDFTGGTIAVFLGERLLQASYTREAEAAADEFALNMLNRAGVDSSGMAEFFEKVQEMEGETPKLPKYFATHPPSEARAERARDNSVNQTVSGPVLNESEWQALKKICDT